MNPSYLTILLHAHLPFVRHPDHETFLEERWLFEAINETYLPLLRVLYRLETDSIPFKITFSISSTLQAMLCDELLQSRYITHTEKLLNLAERELKRNSDNPDVYKLALMYRDLFKRNLTDYTHTYKKDILKGFDYFYKTGRIELITTPATHPYLPLYQQYPNAIDAQIKIGINRHVDYFGKHPKGLWLPECGYYPGLEQILKENGVRYFFLAAHGILFADNRPGYGIYAPIKTANGLTAFGRDLASANAVWSSEEGYPGDFVYRDFYKDIGFDLPLDYIGPYIESNHIRVNTGFKYHAITGPGETKRIYNPEEAAVKAEEHAENFLYNQSKRADKIGGLMDWPPLYTCPYDAELFGHWWFEGPLWLENLIRKIDESYPNITMILPSEYMKKNYPLQHTQPAFSSWGNKGYSEVWLDGSNDWIYRHTHKAIERMGELAERFKDEKGLKERALNQAAREVLLSQASDWPFIIRAGTVVSYAENRIKTHITNFNKIYESLCRGNVSTEWLTNLERINNIYPDINFRVFLADTTSFLKTTALS